MTIEEIAKELRPDAVFARRSKLLNALEYEMSLLDDMVTETEKLLDTPEVMMSTEKQDEINERVANLIEEHNQMDNAHTEVWQSLTSDQMQAYTPNENF